MAGILLTHGHFDHITAADEVRKKFQTKIYASGKEKELMADPRMNVSVMMGESVSLKADVWLEDGQELEMLGETMRCILTPGHTGGGMCFLFSEGVYVIFRGYIVSGVGGQNGFSYRQQPGTDPFCAGEASGASGGGPGISGTWVNDNDP